MSKATAAAETRAVSICLSPTDLEKLDAIRKASFVDSRSRAARVALARWHEWLEVHPSALHRKRPEFAEAVSPHSGGRTTKFYFDSYDDMRLDHLKAWTGEKVVGRLIRAAIGWYAARV